VFAELLKRVDVWMESSRPGTYPEHLGITDEWALEQNPKLVIVHVSGFGQYSDPACTGVPPTTWVGQGVSAGQRHVTRAEG
jgi:L-carnitine CoA-transferase